MNGEIYAPADAKEAYEQEQAFRQAELETLREFYRAWEILHAIPRDSLHRKQAEEAAQALVSQAHILRRMYV